MPHYPPPYSRAHGHDGLLDQNQPEPDPSLGRTRLPPSLLEAAEEWRRAQALLPIADPVAQEQYAAQQAAMAGDPGHASIGATASRASRIGQYLQHKLPRQAREAVQGALYGTGAGALRVGQALWPGEQPRMAAMEQYGLGQIPEEGIGRATGLLGTIAPEFTGFGDAADLGRAYGHLTNREDGRWDPEWGGAALSSLAAVPFVGTPAAKVIKARRGVRAATEAAGVAQEAARVAQEERRIATVADRYSPEAPTLYPENPTIGPEIVRDPELQGLLAATETAGIAQEAERAARGAEPPISQAQEAQDAIIDRVIESPNIQRLIQTPAAEAAEGQRNLRGIMDYEAPKIQGTMEDVSVFEPPPGYRGAPHPFTESLLSSRTVPRVLDADFERGLEIMGPRAALNWYELGPARQFMDELGGPYSFDDLNLIGGAASVQTPVHQEIANTAIIMFARKRGISIDEAIDEYFKVTRRPRGVTPEGLLARPWGLSDDTYARAGRYLEEGVAAPVNYRGPDWKVPSYVGARQGAGTSPFANPALDTHERRRIWQAIQENPRLRRLAEEGLTPAMRADEVMPIRNAADYSRISDLYRGGQDRYGLITPAQYQAPRWVGGGKATGLATSPTETFVEILADVTAATATDRGLGTSARELRELLGRALSGDDFLIHYPSARELRESVPRVPR